VGKPHGRRPLARPTRRWEDNIKVDITYMGWKDMGLDRSGSGKRQVAGSCEFSNETSGYIKGGKFFVLSEDLLASQEGPRSIQ
jgi:hypothetical protein